MSSFASVSLYMEARFAELLRNTSAVDEVEIDENEEARVSECPADDRSVGGGAWVPCCMTPWHRGTLSQSIDGPRRHNPYGPDHTRQVTLIKLMGPEARLAIAVDMLQAVFAVHDRYQAIMDLLLGEILRAVYHDYKANTSMRKQSPVPKAHALHAGMLLNLTPFFRTAIQDQVELKSVKDELQAYTHGVRIKDVMAKVRKRQETVVRDIVFRVWRHHSMAMSLKRHRMVRTTISTTVRGGERRLS